MASRFPTSNQHHNFRLCQAARGAMVKQGGGSIVLIGSTAGQTPSPDLMAYEIAKAGVAHMARCLADELACDRITVNCVAPGLIRSHSSSYLWGNESLLQSMAVGFSYLSQALVPR